MAKCFIDSADPCGEYITLADGSLACKGAPLGGWYACAFGPSTLKSCHGYCVDLLECSTSDILFEIDFVWTIFDWQNFVYVHKHHSGA